MKYNDTIEVLMDMSKNFIESIFIDNKKWKGNAYKFVRDFQLNNSVDNNVGTTNVNNNEVYSESVQNDDNNEFLNDNKDDNCYNKQQNTSSYSKGAIDSIAEELTPVRLQQAIILSEIVGKPRSKTRKRRRF